mgnify:CR=1 FL=1
MKERILFVDDEVHILDSFRVGLRKDYDVDTAMSPEVGLTKIRDCGPYTLVVSDLKMPSMDGIDFLIKVKELSPNTVRIMLTGHGDFDKAMDAVNRGHIFRFLQKPCPTDVLKSALEDGLRQYRLVMAERDLLQKTLRGTIALVNEILALVNPEAFGRSQRILRYVKFMIQQKKLKDGWRYEVAAMLSQVGCLTLPETTLEKIHSGTELSKEEMQLFEMHPLIGSSLLGKIPRMEEVARMVAYQEKCFDGTGVPRDTVQGKDIPLGARMLKIVLDYDAALSRLGDPAKAFLAIEAQRELYDPEFLYLLEACLGVEARCQVREVTLDGLREGMLLNASVVAADGVVIARNGAEITSALYSRLEAFATMVGTKQRFSVLVPVTPEQ